MCCNAYVKNKNISILGAFPLATNAPGVILGSSAGLPSHLPPPSKFLKLILCCSLYVCYLSRNTTFITNLKFSDSFQRPKFSLSVLLSRSSSSVLSLYSRQNY